MELVNVNYSAVYTFEFVSLGLVYYNILIILAGRGREIVCILWTLGLVEPNVPGWWGMGPSHKNC